jgi:hypothetical protein
VFDSLEEVREITETWLREYNEVRPHDSPGRVPPVPFLPRQIKPEECKSDYVLDGDAYADARPSSGRAGACTVAVASSRA